MPKEPSIINFKNGFSVLEILLSGSLFAILVTVLLGAVYYGAEGNVAAGVRVRAVFLAEEGLEAMRDIREEAFSGVATGTYGLAIVGNRWVTSGTQELIGNFTRKIIVSSTDSKRKNVTAEVQWQQSVIGSGIVSLTTELTDWHTLGWGAPTQEASIDISGTNDGLKLQVQGNFVYMIRPGGTPDFVIIDVTNPASPFERGSLVLGGNPTNIAVSGNAAYVSSDSNTEELQVVDISNPDAPSLVGTLNLVGTVDVNGIFAVGTTVFMVRPSSANPEFLVIDVSDPSAPSLVGSLDLGAAGLEVWVSGTTAYVASDSNTEEFRVINVTNPAAPVQIASLNLTGTVNATTIHGAGGKVIVGQGNNLHLISVSTPSSPVLLGTFVAGGTVNDVVASPDGSLAFLATAATAGELQVLDISGSSPVAVSSVNLAATINGVTYAPSPAERVYVAGTSNTAEFIGIKP